ncbi:hypothetical protein M5689_012472 [Euphorbia peplus]|nr:hypothetical protein M5689_012472 [Euphorbia peplus]
MAKSLHLSLVITLLLIFVMASHCRLLETEKHESLISERSKISLEESIQKVCQTNNDCKSDGRSCVCLKNVGCICID